MAAENWLDLEEVARRSGLSAGHLRRLCEVRFAKAGAAKLDRPRAGGRVRWFLRESVLQGLMKAQEARPASARAGFLSLPIPKDIRLKALARRKACEGWFEFRRKAAEQGIKREAALRQFLANFQKQFGSDAPAPSTLMGWARWYKAGGLDALVDGRAMRFKTRHAIRSEQRAAQTSSDGDTVRRELAIELRILENAVSRRIGALARRLEGGARC